MSSEKMDALSVELSADGTRATLVVRSEGLSLEHLDEFDSHCRELRATGRGELVVDLSSLARIHSGFIGIILFVNAEAVENGAVFFLVAQEKIKATFEQIAPGLLDIRESA